MSPNGAEQPEEFRIFCVDGGGIRGLISALVTAKIEQLLRERDGDAARIADYFHLFAGTSTGGLIALALTRPEPPSADELAKFYTDDGPKIFSRSLTWKLRTGGGLWGPKYDNEHLRNAVLERLGNGNLAEAERELLVTSYDMTNREPFFFKGWKAQKDPNLNFPVVDAALSTAAAPTYFPSQEPDMLKGHALVDGGVFAGNPTIAAIAEALGRTSNPRPTLDEMLVVSIGTGDFQEGFPPSEVHDWGDLGWVKPARGEEPPILSVLLGGASDGTNYWAHMLLNHEPGNPPPAAEAIGRGERYFRFQAPLAKAVQMDDASPKTLGLLTKVAEELIEERKDEIAQIVEGLTQI